MSNDDEIPDDYAEEFSIPDDEPDPEVEPLNPHEKGIAAAAVVLSITMFMGTAWRTMRGMIGHTPLSSLHTLGFLTVPAFFVFVLSAHALKVTRPHEGSILRGLALTAAVLSSLTLLLLANSIVTLFQIKRGGGF